MSHESVPRVPIWKRGGFYVSGPQLQAALTPLREQVARLQQEVEDLRAAIPPPQPPG